MTRRGTRGRPALLAPPAVAAWLARQDTEQRDATRALIRRTDAQTLRARDTLAHLVVQYTRPADVERTWGALVGHVRSQTTRMLDVLIPRLSIPSTTATIAPPADRRVLSPDELRVILARDPAEHPWPAPAVPAIQRCVARGLSIEISPRGWHEIDDLWKIGMQSRAASTVSGDVVTVAVRELLTALARTPATIAPPSEPVATVPVIRTPSRTLRAAHAQRANVEAALIDLRRAIASLAVVPRETAIRDGQARVIAFKTKLLRLPSIAARSAHDSDVIRRAVAEALTELEPRTKETTK